GAALEGHLGSDEQHGVRPRHRRDVYHLPPLSHRVRKADDRDRRAQRDEAREPALPPPGRRDLGDGLREGVVRNFLRCRVSARAMTFYYSKRKVRPKESEETGELNIVP